MPRGPETDPGHEPGAGAHGLGDQGRVDLGELQLGGAAEKPGRGGL